ncbi:MAG: PrkA family serine protein kinase [Planctomycetota bacterium]|jgi:serine protein kinase
MSATPEVKKSELVDAIRSASNPEQFRELNWTGTFGQYLDLVISQPEVLRSAHQRLYDMILAHGCEDTTVSKEKLTKYKFFSDIYGAGRDAIYGLERSLASLVDHFKSAAHGYGTERRVLLLHGPVGSSKSTIVRLLKTGLEEYSRTKEGALYSFSWRLEQDGEEVLIPDPMNDEPLRLLPEDVRGRILDRINESRAEGDGYRLRVQGEPSPVSRYYMTELMHKYDGDLDKVLQHVVVRRVVLSERDRIGIGTFQPKDEKNQDSTELTGDINYRKLAEFGSESDPRAFNFDGEFNVANRGLIEFIEVLKLDVAFLYDLLGASQEHNIKPKKFAQTHIDEVIIGHTNEPEYKKLMSNELMEAFRDRTVKIDVPYNLRLSNEIQIYEKDFNSRSVSKHIAPHTLEVAAMWAILTRLKESNKGDLSLLDKLKLYNGKSLERYTEENVKELREENPREGLEGISPRYIQDKVSNALVRGYSSTCVNPFMVLNELEEGLDHHSLISAEEVRKRYKALLAIAKDEYAEIVKNEVQRAIAADEEQIQRLCANYIDNVKAYTQKEKVRNAYTGQEEEPDERLMRSIEEKIDVRENAKDDFRREIMNYIGALAVEGKSFDYRMNPRLQRALEKKLFEDQKDSIKLTSLVSSVVDRETQEKIDVIKSRLIKNFGYNEESATDALNFVASIFARGDVKSRG